MRSINKVALLGNIGKQPEVRHTGNGTPVMDINVATNTFRKNKEGTWTTKTEWHKIVAWGKLADFCGRYAQKGMLILAEGTIQYRKYTDRNGQERDRAEIVAGEIRFLNTKRSEESNYDGALSEKADGAEEHAGGTAEEGPAGVGEPEPLFFGERTVAC